MSDTILCQLRGSTVRRLLLVRAGSTQAHAGGRIVGTLDPPLSAEGRAEIQARARHWEWTDAVYTSPARRARESASLLVPNAPDTRLEPGVGPIDYGPWQGVASSVARVADPVTFSDHEAGVRGAFPTTGESLTSVEARVFAALRRILARPHTSPLVVCHGDVIREIVWQLAGVTLPPGRPWPAEMALLTRETGGAFRPGRRSSDPVPLRSALEREGLSGRADSFDERHAGALELRVAS